MSLTSINTNWGAMAALQSLGANRALLERTQARLATGLAVPSVRENAANWSIAQVQRGDIRALGVVDQSLQRAGGLLELGISAGETVSDLLIQMKQKALAAADAGLDAAARAALDADFATLRDQIARVAEGATLGGATLVGAGASDQRALMWHTVTATTTTTGPGGAGGNGNGGGNGKGKGKGAGGPPTSTATTTTATNTLTVRSASLALGGANVTVSATASIGTASQAAAMLGELDASIANVGRAVARFGVDFRAVERQRDAVARHQAVLETAVSNLVDADVGREAARAVALRTREALILESLSLANAAPGRLLTLFERRA